MFFVGFLNILNGQNTSCLLFDGYNDYVKYYDDATLDRLNNASNYTIEAWIFITSWKDYQRIANRWDHWEFYLRDDPNGNGSGQLGFRVYNGSWHLYYSNDDAVPLNQWAHVAVIRNTSSGGIKFYVNGIDESAGNYNGYSMPGNSSDDNLYIGETGNGSNNFEGKIDEVRLKNVAENPNNLQSKTTDPPYTSDGNTAALFHFDENSGTTTVNEASSTNANLYNGVAWSDVDGLPMQSTQALDLISFSANKYNNYVQLNWETEFDITGKEFKIQRSSDLKNWKEIGVLPYSIQKVNYSFIDDQPLRKNYYRIQTLDFDGISTYSKVLSISISENSSISISPNPVKDVIYVSGINEKSPVQYKVYNTFGEKIQQEITNGIIRLKNTVPGMYFLQIKRETKKFIVK